MSPHIFAKRHHSLEAVEHCGADMRHDVILGDATILIASPNHVTPHHFNWDCSFLAQITGNKKLHVFNGTDRTLLTQIELERFCAGDINGAVYQPARKRTRLFTSSAPGTVRTSRTARRTGCKMATTSRSHSA
jgi:hypothetical protein